MTIQELNNLLTQEMKKYIKSSNHNETGALMSSIKFNCTDKNGLKITFKTNDYIQYLDNGEFVDNFFSLTSTLNIITDYLSTNIITNLD